jgi:hypothetical protein
MRGFVFILICSLFGLYGRGQHREECSVCINSWDVTFIQSTHEVELAIYSVIGVACMARADASESSVAVEDK